MTDKYLLAAIEVIGLAALLVAQYMHRTKTQKNDQKNKND